MMLSEENEMVLSFAQDFIQSDLSDSALEVEKNGIPSTLMARMAERGYLSAMLPEKLGGAGLDRTSYMLLLESLAKHSPSVAFYALLQNSLVLQALTRSGNDGVEEFLRSVASGKGSGSILMEHLLSNRTNVMPRLKMVGGGVEGSASHVLHPTASFFIAPLMHKDSDALALIEGGARTVGEAERLGFRGIGFSSVEFNPKSSKVTVLAEKGAIHLLRETLLEASTAVAAVALGICEGSIDRAVQYSGERHAFKHTLKEYQPVAYSLSSIKAEIEVLREYLYSPAGAGRREGLIAKLQLTDAAVRASKISMQIHGGNGYFQDYQVEKYYRDAMALQALTGNRNRELQMLSLLTLGEGSGSI